MFSLLIGKKKSTAVLAQWCRHMGALATTAEMACGSWWVVATGGVRTTGGRGGPSPAAPGTPECSILIQEASGSHSRGGGGRLGTYVITKEGSCKSKRHMSLQA
jgi:hypothetical protein